MEVLVTATLKVHKQQQEAEAKQEQDRRLRNTKLLLRNYQTFKNYTKESLSTEEEDQDTPTQRLVLNGEDIVASIRMTTNRTLVMVAHLDKALKALQFVYEQEMGEDKEAGTPYDVLHSRYVLKKAVGEIAEEYKMNERTVYKQINAAAERLSVMLFGVYGLEIT